MKKRAAILVSSDSGYKGEREDKSGPAIRKIVQEAGYEVTEYEILPDEQEMLSAWMKRIADEGRAELILTSGGTGFSRRDCMPEATIYEKSDAQPCSMCDPGEYTDCKSAWKSESSHRMSGICHVRIRSRSRNFNRRSTRLCKKVEEKWEK